MSDHIQIGGTAPVPINTTDDVYFLVPTDNDAVMEILARARLKLKDIPNLYRTTEPERKWDDNTLFVYLLEAADLINASPPATDFTFDVLYEKRQGALMTTGMVYIALIAQSILENEGQFQYSDNGLTLNMNKVQGYSALAQQYGQMFDNYLLNFKKTIRPKGRGLLSSRTQMPVRLNRIMRLNNQFGGRF
jgi:hypothetical protein